MTDRPDLAARAMPASPRTAAGGALLAYEMGGPGEGYEQAMDNRFGRHWEMRDVILAIEAEAAQQAAPLDVEGVIAELVHAESLVQQGLEAMKQATDTLGGIARLVPAQARPADAALHE